MISKSTIQKYNATKKKKKKKSNRTGQRRVNSQKLAENTKETKPGASKHNRATQHEKIW
jgi:hypothetical protein